MAGTVSITHYPVQNNVGRIVATCTADGADGSYPATALPAFAGRIVALQTNPGAVAPTANYDITLPDADGLDRLQGVGANRHTTNSEAALIVFSGTAIHPPVHQSETLTLTIANNAVNSAVTVIAITYLTQ
jgi:hypothetical protein